jgi:hypothetical protein
MRKKIKKDDFFSKKKKKINKKTRKIKKCKVCNFVYIKKTQSAHNMFLIVVFFKKIYFC